MPKVVKFLKPIIFKALANMTDWDKGGDNTTAVVEATPDDDISNVNTLKERRCHFECDAM